MVSALRRRRLGRWLALAVGIWFLAGGSFRPQVGHAAAEAGGPATGSAAATAGEVATLTGTLQETGDDAHAPTQESASAGEHAEGEEEGHPKIRTVFFVLIAILVAGKLLGELAERRGQPAVLGELVAGVILGSSVLGIIPEAGPLYEIVPRQVQILGRFIHIEEPVSFGMLAS